MTTATAPASTTTFVWAAANLEHTTADGASSPTARMTIKHDGKVGLNTTAPATALDVNGTMTTTITWAVASLERSTADDMVQTIHYAVSANDGTYASSAYGSVGLEPADPESMVPYTELTPELCIQWVKDKLGNVAEIEAALQAQIDEQRQPKTAAGLPWTV